MKPLNIPKRTEQTIKADREIIAKIKEIAKKEERTLLTVTNRLLKRALLYYDKESA